MCVRNRYFLFLSFKGTSYHGWQVQPNGVTVQELLDKALSLILGHMVATTGAGRTDTGVHALFFCAHFDSNEPDLDCRKNLIYRINSLLPGDISVSSIRKVTAESNARFSATSRTYKYFITREKNPFSEESAWFIHGDLDTEAMNRASEYLLAHSDFTSFSRLHSGSKTNICKITRAEWKEEESQLIFTITADRFLRNMVRAIVGTLAEVGRGKITVQEFDDIIKAKSRARAGKSAPARGLFLTSIEYPEKIFI